MWNEIVLFVPRDAHRQQIRSFLAERGGTLVDSGGYQWRLPEGPLEVRDEEDLWPSYSADERAVIEHAMPEAVPLLILYVNKTSLPALLSSSAVAAEWLVDDGEAGPLTLQTVGQFLARHAS